MPALPENRKPIGGAANVPRLLVFMPNLDDLI
jgi:hypothetical protein